MSPSVRTTATDCFAVAGSIEVRRDLFGRLGRTSTGTALRGRLSEISEQHCGFALPPKYVPPHPRLSPVAAIHFDQYNSSVTDLSGPIPGEVDATLIRHGFPLGTCLNFLHDDRGNVYGFCGSLRGAGGTIGFDLTLFDDDLEKVSEYEITRFPTGRFLDDEAELPVDLGYFVMDDRGRVIVAKDRTDIVFLRANGSNEIEAVRTWHLNGWLDEVLAQHVGERDAKGILEEGLGQVVPAYDRGYWVLGLGLDDENDPVPAFVGTLNDDGAVEDAHVFSGEIVENGMAVDGSGAYIVTDHAIYKLGRGADCRPNVEWRRTYPRATRVKPGTETLSRHGSGSTPTLLGNDDDLVAITDNADDQVNLWVFERQTGRTVCQVPLFEEGKSANENTVVGYGDSIVVQNFYDAPQFRKSMWGLEPGLVRVDVSPDRSGGEVVWTNETFASTATVRLSTKTGLLYAPVQTSTNEQYAMALIDFHTGRTVQRVPMGRGRAYRIGMSPAYFVPGDRLVQPVRRGIVVFQKHAD